MYLQSHSDYKKIPLSCFKNLRLCSNGKHSDAKYSHFKQFLPVIDFSPPDTVHEDLGEGTWNNLIWSPNWISTIFYTYCCFILQEKTIQYVILKTQLFIQQKKHRWICCLSLKIMPHNAWKNKEIIKCKIQDVAATVYS